MTHSVPLIRPPVPGGDLRNYSELRTAPGPYVMNGDFLRLNASSTDASATLQLNGRLLTVQGEIVPFNTTMSITGTGNQTAVPVPLVDGWIIGFDAFVSAGTITDGEVVASVDVVQGSGTGLTRVMNLASGEITNTRSLGLGAYLINGPATTAVAPTLGVSSVDGLNPGDQATWIVTAGQYWQIQGFTGQLVTSGTVATRRVSISINDGSNLVAFSSAEITQLLSLTRLYYANINTNPAATINNTSIVFVLPNILCGPSYQISTQVQNMQAGDQWSFNKLAYRQY